VAANAKACVNLAVQQFGKLDILINNAGVFPAVGYIEEFPLDKVDYLVQNNIYTTLMMTHFAVPELRKTKGTIVTTGLGGRPGRRRRKRAVLGHQGL
jgi:NADP-dependent 3-hydroxy acid dehydrogenase YdfG